MPAVRRFGVSMSSDLLRAFDRLIKRKGYKNRSEAIRDIVRDLLVRNEWEESDQEVMGAVTLLYDHETGHVPETLTDLQHRQHDAIVCSTHVHMDQHNCLETIVVRGTSRVVRTIADQLLSTRGVKHGGLVSTSTGRTLP
ncbi:MAG: nickel-responsive transcriptional regulator NikR [Armatimonadota bacterium]